ncbi:MAG: PEP-CTERM sorting domain-containing protein [Planctomycetia bacterium]|nr:PEP-CTERM sorting domain-containing protein [Planctomycetia bacterium]
MRLAKYFSLARTFVAWATAVILVASAVPSSAATYTWIGANNATWSTNTNWSPTGVPTISNTDSAVFASGTGGANVTLTANASVLSTIINRDTTFLGAFQVSTGTSLTVANNVNVSFQNWQITGTSGTSTNVVGSGATITVNGTATNATAGSITLNANSLLSFAGAVNFNRNNPIGGSGTVAWAATSGSNGGGNAFRFNLSDTVTFRINSDAAATPGNSQANIIVSSGTNTVLLQRDFDFMTPTTTGTSGILGLGYARTIASPANPAQRNASMTIAGPYTLSANLLGVTFLSGTQTLLIDSGTVQIGDFSAGKAQGVYTTNGSSGAAINYGVANPNTSTLEIGGAASAGTLRVNANSSFNATTDASGSNSLGYQVSVLGTSTLVNNGAWTNRNFKDATILTGLNIGSTAMLSGTGSFDLRTGYTGVGATGIGKAVSVSGIVAPGDVVGGVNGVGTLTIASGTVAFGATSKVAISGSGATLDKLVLNAPVSVTNGATIDFAGTNGLTQGRYQVVTGSSGVNTFTASNAPAAYTFGTSGTDAYLWAKPVFGTISTTPAAAQVITGGTVAFTYTVPNASPTGGQDLAFTSAAGSGIVGTVSGTTTVGPQGTSAPLSGLSYVGGTPGLAQAATFTVSDPNAFATSGTGTVTLNVLDHATPGFATAAGSAVLDPLATTIINLNFGSIDVSAGAQTLTYSLTNLASQTYGPNLTAGLALTAFTGDGDGFASGLTSFADLVAGTPSSLFTAQFTPTTEGSFSRSYTLSFYDNQSLAGSTQRRDLTVNMEAVVVTVPEPGTLALAGVGVILAGWRLARRRVS